MWKLRENVGPYGYTIIAKNLKNLTKSVVNIYEYDVIRLDSLNIQSS